MLRFAIFLLDMKLNDILLDEVAIPQAAASIKLIYPASLTLYFLIWRL